ncbi:hypothetical protein [Lysinibacillus fusiformis]|uniref:hypothetical protein n=1 Tax=Lysinibacillus fusiformis TaxID=28031 RepID=UPI003CFCF267
MLKRIYKNKMPRYSINFEPGLFYVSEVFSCQNTNICSNIVANKRSYLEECEMMKEQLIKAMQRNQLLNMMYMVKDGMVSKRRIKIIKIVGDSFQAYCFNRQAKRTFMIDSVLAVVPISHKDRSVVC